MNEQQRDVSLAERIQRSLERTGYPLELETARVLGGAGFDVVQSDYYKDPETDKYREIDVVAYSSSTVSRGELLVQIVVECKKSSNPWVVFSARRSADRWGVHARYDLDAKLSVQRRLGTSGAMEILSRLSHDLSSATLFSLPKKVGYAVRQVSLGSGEGESRRERRDDRAFSSLMSVISASEELVGRFEGGLGDSVAIPAIVLRGPLFEVDHEMQPKQIARALLCIRRPGVQPMQFVHVIASDHLEDWARDAKSSADYVVGLARELQES